LLFNADCLPAATSPRVTASHSNSAVKLGRAVVVLSSGRGLEGTVLQVLFLLPSFSISLFFFSSFLSRSLWDNVHLFAFSVLLLFPPLLRLRLRFAQHVHQGGVDQGVKEEVLLLLAKTIQTCQLLRARANAFDLRFAPATMRLCRQQRRLSRLLSHSFREWLRGVASAFFFARHPKATKPSPRGQYYLSQNLPEPKFTSNYHG
jgi:hypothetical protein